MVAEITHLNPNSIHLINRANFGPKLEWLNADNKIILEDLDKTQNWLFETMDEYCPISKRNGYSFIFEEEQIDQNRIRKQAPIEGLIFDWVNIMVTSTNPLREIVALFWHHHIPCGNVGHFGYNKLLLEIYRKHGLGKLRPLITKIAANPAMMSWLSANQSHKDNPNENFPRELMELFLLGEGHYNYQDVKEVSKAFTGRRTDYTDYPYKMYLEKNAFDNSYKTLFGKSGNWNGDDVIDIILGEYQTARYISRSALIFFLGQVPANNYLDECAKVYYNSGYNFKSLLEQIFCSHWFYLPDYLNNKVKTPVELFVNLQRKTGMRCIGIKTTNYFLRFCGQRLFRPPTVAGWPIGEEWLVGNDLINRVFLPDVLLKIANRSSQKESFKYKISSRIRHNDIRHFRYSWDSIFNEVLFKNTLKENSIKPSHWMLNIEMKNQDLSDIITRPEYQYS